MDLAFNRLVAILQRRYQSFFSPARAVPFALRTSTGLSYTFGDGEPAFAIVAVRENGVAALRTLDLSRIAEAYVRGDLEIDGDLRRALMLRTAFADRHPIAFLWRFIQPLLFGQVRSDAKWISRHYDFPAEFYLCFLDDRHRCYSQGIFARDDEPLADAMTRKLDFALEAIGATAGSRVLDIGGGLGGDDGARRAENLDRNRELIESNWRAELFRKFRLYLWACADSFERDLAQAYRWILRKPELAHGA